MKKKAVVSISEWTQSRASGALLHLLSIACSSAEKGFLCGWFITEVFISQLSHSHFTILVFDTLFHLCHFHHKSHFNDIVWNINSIQMTHHSIYHILIKPWLCGGGYMIYLHYSVLRRWFVLLVAPTNKLCYLMVISNYISYHNDSRQI